MVKARVACFIDGFNLYHSIKNLEKPHLKWVDLWKLTETFIDPSIHDLTAVYYFSAYATWLSEAHQRHQWYVKALQSVGVTPVMGKFKARNKQCLHCHREWTEHEEKETDVNAAIWILNEARKDTFDYAFLMSGDSDLSPAVRMLKMEYPEKIIKVIAMVGRPQSKELGRGIKKLAKIKKIHLERSLFPSKIYDPKGHLVAHRPAKYDPPRNDIAKRDK